MLVELIPVMVVVLVVAAVLEYVSGMVAVVEVEQAAILERVELVGTDLILTTTPEMDTTVQVVAAAAALAPGGMPPSGVLEVVVV